MDERMQDVVVVGGGPAGLAAAALVARGGRPVVLFERAAHLGGRAATRDRGGFLFNLGAHAIYQGGAASRLLHELGVWPDGGSPKAVQALDGGRLRLFPTNLTSLFRTDLLDVGDKLELGRLFAWLPRARPAEHAGQSVEQWLDATARRPRVRRLLAAIARTSVYSQALDLVSAELLLARLQLSLRPVHYVDGGWSTIVDGLRRVAESAGARIVAEQRVERIAPLEGGWTVRPADGRATRARAVVVATPPHEAAPLLGGAAPALAERLAATQPIRIACLDVALRRLPRPGAAVVQDLDRPRFLTAQSLVARIAPPGAALIHTFHQLDPRQPGDPRDDERALEELLDAAQPGWRDELVERVFLPRIEASGILPTAAAGGFAGRPSVAVDGAPGLYLAGDWVGDEGFQLDASLASAAAAARNALERTDERQQAA